MTRNYRWIGAVALASCLASAPAEAQFYGGGYWGGGGLSGGQTPQGDFARGAGVYAMGMGQYNVQTAQARSINATTAMQWNQYLYNSRVQAAQIYRAKNAKDQAREKADYNAIQTRLRDAPNSVDIANGNALDVALEQLTDPKVFQKAIYYGSKVKLGGETIRDIPFAYASAGISTSVHQLTQGGPPAALKRDEFGPNREKLKALAAELRKEGEELDAPKPETIKKAKEEIMATKAKIEATLPHNSQEYRDAEKYVKSLYGLASMLETPAVNVLLAGVEKHPDATVGDLLGFMMNYNLRFGAAETPRQREVYIMLYPILDRLRDEIVPVPGAPAPVTPEINDAPGAVFGSMGYNHGVNGGNTPPPPAPK